MNLTIPEEFPISEKERQLIKKKILMAYAWCGEGAACSSGKPCPFKDKCGTPETRTRFIDLYDWIMEAEI